MTSLRTPDTALMSATSTTPLTPAAPAAGAGARARAARSGDAWVHLIVLALVGLAWQLSRLGLFRSGDDVSYWMAVVGGSMMLAVFLYPLRKYLRGLHRLGAVKWWLWAHIVFGLAGPWLILLHSTFHIGSLNAGVALGSMVVVVASGIAGRFLYVRLQRGLDGERTTLRELQARAGFVESDARSRLHFAPAVEARLVAFEQRELDAAPGWATHLRRVAWLPWQQWRTARACRAELDEAIDALARQRGWEAAERDRRRRKSRRLIDAYLGAVVRVAQFTAYERVFALWHVAHLPFVYLLVISAVVHVVAVHAY
jgi:hypothetical protein